MHNLKIEPWVGSSFAGHTLRGVISYNLSRLRNKVIHLRTLFILKLIAQYAYYSGFMLSQKHPPRPDRHIHAFWTSLGTRLSKNGLVPRLLNCAWAYPKTLSRKKSEGSGQLTALLWLSGGKYRTHQALNAFTLVWFPDPSFPPLSRPAHTGRVWEPN